MINDRYKFLCGVKVKYTSDEGEDTEIIIRAEPDSITKEGKVCFNFHTFIEKLKERSLSKNEMDRCVDYVSMYETDVYNLCAFDPEYIVQSTGLKDIRNHLIYEGDIISINKYDNWPPKVIEWKEFCYNIKDTYILVCQMEIDSYRIEVIGNIYENKELVGE